MAEKRTTAGGVELQLVIFRLAGEEFGMEISQVREIIRLQDITPMPRAPEFIEGVINLRGQIIAVMDLAKRFGISGGDRTDKTRIVVTEVGGSTVGLIVDEVPEVLRISEGEVDPTPEMIESKVHADFIRGVGKLEDRLIIMLAADKIMNSDELKKVAAVTN